MSDLTEFLLARIEEDARLGDVVPVVRFNGSPPIESHSPARVRAECEAKRRIIALVAPEEFASVTAGGTTARFILHTLAEVYAEHPDCREEWRA